MFGYYAYAYYTGGILIFNATINDFYNAPYNGGDIMTCFFGVVFGVFSLGMATSNIKAITEGKVAGKMAFDIIDRVSAIKLEERGSKKLTDVQGRIEFKNVSFTYPTRKD